MLYHFFLMNNEIVIGERESGKTALTLRFMNGEFRQEYVPQSRGLFTSGVMLLGEQNYVSILDVDNPEEHFQYTENTIQRGHGFVVVYSVTDQQSFGKAESFIDQIMKLKKKDEMVLMMLVGNKIDSQREVTKEEGQQLAAKYDILFSETSAKTGEYVDKCFTKLFSLISQYQHKTLWDKLMKPESLSEKKQCVTM
jgi:small GTP-binding protein